MTSIEKFYSNLLKSVIVFSICDGLLTLFFVLKKDATELNPLLNILLVIDPNGALFLMVKIMLTFGGTWLLWTARNQRFGKTAIKTVFGVYLLLSLYWCWLLFN